MKKSEEIIGLAKSSFVALKSLRCDYKESIHSTYQPFETNGEIIDTSNEKTTRIIQSLEKVELGINQAELIINLMEYFYMIEANQMRLNAIIMRLSEENSWLREEITATQSRLGSFEKTNIDLENQIKDYELKLELRKYEQPLSNSYSNSQLLDSVNLSESTLSGHPLDGPNNEPNYKSQKPGGKNSRASNSKTDNDITNNYNYELPDHLKTLHSLVIEYSSKGRYEVAMALCKQAIQNEMDNLDSKRQILVDETEATAKESDYCSLDIAALHNIFALVYSDLFSSTISYLTRAYTAQGKLIEADLLEEWPSRSIKEFDGNKCKISCNDKYGGWSTSLTNSMHSDECFPFQPFSPTMKFQSSIPIIEWPLVGGENYFIDHGIIFPQNFMNDVKNKTGENMPVQPVGAAEPFGEQNGGGQEPVAGAVVGQHYYECRYCGYLYKGDDTIKWHLINIYGGALCLHLNRWHCQGGRTHCAGCGMKFQCTHWYQAHLNNGAVCR